MSARHLYKVMFVSQGKVYEIYARSVTQGTLFGFIEVERLVGPSALLVQIDRRLVRHLPVAGRVNEDLAVAGGRQRGDEQHGQHREHRQHRPHTPDRARAPRAPAASAGTPGP